MWVAPRTHHTPADPKHFFSSTSTFISKSLGLIGMSYTVGVADVVVLEVAATVVVDFTPDAFCPFADHETTRAAGEHQQDGPDCQEQHRTTMRCAGPVAVRSVRSPIGPTAAVAAGNSCGFMTFSLLRRGSAHVAVNAEDYPTTV